MNFSSIIAVTLLLSCPPLVTAQVDPLPGLQSTEFARTARLYSLYQQKTGSYTVHTQHRNSDGSPKYINALIAEYSPYLKQHAHNPVNWFPWGEEAFARARAENKPIFLSIGYSTCHWCHVMARESFDDEHIAEILNRHFVSIKVDREQQPDIDEIYMTGVQLISGRGGWPMSNFLTPEAEPFFGATYFPPQQFAQLLLKVNEIWHSSEVRLREDAHNISGQIQRLLSDSKSDDVSTQILTQAATAASEKYDKAGGGFSAAPKFPNETLLLFILDQLRRADNAPLQAALEHTLHRMAQGGIYDQVGGGFHRYSTDDKWLVPHFEKMLYNQALLARVYSQAYQLTGKRFYAHILREILDYVLRDMRDAHGCFYSASDADSEEKEGTFFVWTPKQIERVLNPSDAQWVQGVYDITEGGNFEASNILHMPRSYEDIAAEEQVPVAQVYARLENIKAQLYKHREKRIHPLRDEKVITAWSAMMTTAMAQAAVSLSDERYLLAAQQCAQSLYQQQWNEEDGQLWRIGWQGKASVEAVQEDYAFFSEALITLFDSTADKQWLTRAQAITNQMIERFGDARHGGFFAGSESATTPVIVRAKSTSDGATPSGNSVALVVLEKLWRRTGEFHYKAQFIHALAAMAKAINRYPLGATYALLAVSNHQAGEAGDLVYFAEGHVVARLLAEDKTQHFTLQLSIDPDWHINANQVLQEALIPTQVSVANLDWQLDQLVFPPAVEIRLDFQDEPLRVLQGQVSARGQVSQRGSGTEPLRLQLTLQACDNNHCLAPETHTLGVLLKAGTAKQ
tara:strand:+ start:33443 stop:35833 length:2391 start_codon:yes stop_codon:yes gene_type:complete